MKRTIIKLLLILVMSSSLMAGELTRSEKLSLIKDIITLGDVVDEKLNSSNIMKELESNDYTMKKYDNKNYTLSYKIVTNNKDIFAIFKFLNLKDPNISLVTKYHIKKNDVLLISRANKEKAKVVYIGSATGKASTFTEIKSEYKIPKVKLQTQIGAYRNSCGFACSAMLYQFKHNLSPDLKFVNKLASSVGKASLMANILYNEKALKKYDNNAYAHEVTFDDIKAYIRANKPVQVSLYYYSELKEYRASAGKDYKAGHSVVIVGYSESKGVWYINDPLETLKSYKEVPSSYLRSAMKVTNPTVLIIR